MRDLKLYFKYEHGYVNLDEQFIYFTNSGNWADADNLEEKSAKVNAKNNFRNFRMTLFILGTIAVFFLIWMLKSYENTFYLAGGLILTLASIVKFYERYKRNLGAQFKIPLTKIQSIILKENSAQLVFNDARGKEDLIELMQVEAKGLRLLEKAQGKLG